MDHSKESNQLKNELIKLKQKQKDIILRTQANLENLKKQTKTKIEEIQKKNFEDFVNKLIKITKKFDTILELSQNHALNENATVQGIILTIKSISNTLQKIQQHKS
ncbi:Protein GrpE [Buchnera aphidicola (Symydobius americanus)]